MIRRAGLGGPVRRSPLMPVKFWASKPLGQGDLGRRRISGHELINLGERGGRITPGCGECRHEGRFTAKGYTGSQDFSERERIMTSHQLVSVVDDAVQKFTSGYACSQAILSAFASEVGLEQSQAVKLGAGFGGGLGRLGYACGAVTGAVAILGLKLSNGVGGDVTNRDTVYQAVQELCRRFAERHGAIDCRELIGRDISTPEGFAAARQANTFRTICPSFVRSAAEILQTMLSRGG